MSKRKQKEYTGETFEIYGKPYDREFGPPVPMCINEDVRVEKFRVTIEKVEEPIENVHRRLLELWETTDNMHHWLPLREEAERLGLLPLSRDGNRIGEKPYWETEGETP